ncbi:EVE domain-containing protein [Roseibium sp.]|uniref:EVE domain-containing protein n=1 Tax=Roseibium sp. TaxID=1936156 RepID=UPI003D149896
MPRAWIAVASAAHVRIARAGGFMQVNHGKAAPLRRITPGDRVIYYSPTETYGGKDRVQAFTAFGVVRKGVPYLGEMSGCFHPWRRDVDWLDIEQTPIRPLLGDLAFTRDTPNWGYQLRFGLFEIGNADADLVCRAMTQAQTKLNFA